MFADLLRPGETDKQKVAREEAQETKEDALQHFVKERRRASDFAHPKTFHRVFMMTIAHLFFSLHLIVCFAPFSPFYLLPSPSPISFTLSFLSLFRVIVSWWVDDLLVPTLFLSLITLSSSSSSSSYSFW